MTKTPPFHLAFPVSDLNATRRFYSQVLGCHTGREDECWMDIDFFGHQITAHLTEQMPEVATNRVDGKDVPTSHFGAILGWVEWHVLADRLRESKVRFMIEPYLRFEGQPGEQVTMFLGDPSGNGLEFKAFKNPENVFKTT